LYVNDSSKGSKRNPPARDASSIPGFDIFINYSKDMLEYLNYEQIIDDLKQDVDDRVQGYLYNTQHLIPKPMMKNNNKVMVYIPCMSLSYERFIVSKDEFVKDVSDNALIHDIRYHANEFMNKHSNTYKQEVIEEDTVKEVDKNGKEVEKKKKVVKKVKGIQQVRRRREYEENSNSIKRANRVMKQKEKEKEEEKGTKKKKVEEDNNTNNIDMIVSKVMEKIMESKYFKKE
jgi:Arc/MetJ-type ribon-helix-helix transcriptional regulator